MKYNSKSTYLLTYFAMDTSSLICHTFNIENLHRNIVQVLSILNPHKKDDFNSLLITQCKLDFQTR